jgi:cytoskeletal protein CcmA (bactofilin family)
LLHEFSIFATPTQGGAVLNRQGLFNPADRQRRESRSFDSPAANQPAAPAQPEPARAEAPRPEPEPPRVKPEETKGSRLIVGPDIKLKGAEITDCDTLVVEGRVEASMDSRVMQIAENGSFHGTVGVDIAEIRGRFDGELTCRKQLVIHPSGKVSGKIRYGRIVIEEGGEVAGDVAALGAQKPSVVATVAKSAEAAAR